MTLYEIKHEIEQAIAAMFDSVDEETGEVAPGTVEYLNGLQESYDTKVESLGCYIKNLAAEIEAIKKEEARLKQRRTALENQVERLKGYLAKMLGFENWDKSARVKIGFRTSKPVEITDLEKIPDRFIKVKTETAPDKTAIAAAIKAGEEVPGAVLSEKKNIQIS